jgi:hypothetical protein
MTPGSLDFNIEGLPRSNPFFNHNFLLEMEKQMFYGASHEMKTASLEVLRTPLPAMRQSGRRGPEGRMFEIHKLRPPDQ